MHLRKAFVIRTALPTNLSFGVRKSVSNTILPPSSIFTNNLKVQFQRRAMTSIEAKDTENRGVITPSDQWKVIKQDVWSIFTPLAAEVKAINLGQGFMNFLPPDFVQEAAREAVGREDANQYSHPRGRPRLRKALAASYSPLFKRNLDFESEIIVTAGANEGMFSVFAGFLNSGDEVICMEPFFDQYISNIQMNGGVPVYVPLRAPSASSYKRVNSTDWYLDIEELRSKITSRTKILVINTPHNPIGKVFSTEELLEIGKVAEEHNLLILSDEVYDRLYYSPADHVRIATLANFWKRTITVGSAGKSFGATGWRVGWLVGPEPLIRYALAAHTRVVFCVNSPLQEAVAVGLEHAQNGRFFNDQIKAYESRRARLSAVFDELDLPYTVPEGSYFILVNTTKLRIPSSFSFPPAILQRPHDYRVCYWLAKEIGVVAIPPSDFYSYENQNLAHDLARFAFCKTDDVLDEAVVRLKRLREFM